MPGSDNYTQRFREFKISVDVRNRIFLPIPEAAHILDVSPRTIKRWMRSGKLAYVKLGHSKKSKIRIFYSSIMDMIDEKFHERFERDFKKLFKPKDPSKR